MRDAVRPQCAFGGKCTPMMDDGEEEGNGSENI